MDKKLEEYTAGLIYLKCMGDSTSAFSLAWDIDVHVKNTERTNLANKIYECGYADHSEGWADTHVHNMHIETPTLREDAKTFCPNFLKVCKSGGLKMNRPLKSVQTT